jgi:hypothetical protein
MSILTAERRGDLAEELLPVAAHLVALVHGDGGPRDVHQALARLDAGKKEALLVVLAGLVDPDQPVGKALGWLDFNEHGALTVPAWQNRATVRDLADEVQPELDDDDKFIDEVAVEKYLRGKTSEVTVRERIQAIKVGVEAYGMNYPDFDVLHGLTRGSTSTFISRTRKRYADRGEEFPEIVRPSAPRGFSEAEVIEIRRRAMDGATLVELAMSYDSTRETMRAICQGRTYAQYGGPIRTGRSAKSSKKSREFMCGHADNSRAATKQHEMGEAA